MDLHITRPGLVAPLLVDPEGLTGPTPGQARGPRFRTTSAGRFVQVEVSDANVEQRIVEAVAGMPEGCAATGWAGLRWRRVPWFDGVTGRGDRLPIPVAIDDQVGLRARPGLRLCHGYLLDRDVVDVDGLPVTRVERAVFDAVRMARWQEEAVQIISMACLSDIVNLAELASYRVRLGTRQHTRRFADALELADENLWSPMEATMLLRWVANELPRPLCNRPVFDLAGNHLLTPDLIDPRAGVIGQYDGKVHDLREVRRRDLAREELCREAGLEVVTMLSSDLRDLSDFDRRLKSAYRRARKGSVSRGWTLDLPEGWVDTSTVAKRRALDEVARRRWLKGRAG